MSIGKRRYSVLLYKDIVLNFIITAKNVSFEFNRTCQNYTLSTDIKYEAEVSPLSLSLSLSLSLCVCVCVCVFVFTNWCNAWLDCRVNVSGCMAEYFAEYFYHVAKLQRLKNNQSDGFIKQTSHVSYGHDDVAFPIYTVSASTITQNRSSRKWSGRVWIPILISSSTYPYHKLVKICLSISNLTHWS